MSKYSKHKLHDFDIYLDIKTLAVKKIYNFYYLTCKKFVFTVMSCSKNHWSRIIFR